MPSKPPMFRYPWQPSEEMETVIGRKLKRGSAASRGYDQAWRKLRSFFLSLTPQCEVCKQPATEADHILTVRERPDLRLQMSNLRALCKSCHSRRTVSEMPVKTYRDRGK